MLWGLVPASIVSSCMEALEVLNRTPEFTPCMALFPPSTTSPAFSSIQLPSLSI